ncbi:MAG: glycine-rich domain-containing protein [Kiritimatiellia bacterium]
MERKCRVSGVAFVCAPFACVTFLAAVLLSGIVLAQQQPPRATGGMVARYIEHGTNYNAHIFTNSGTFVNSIAGEIEYLLVGGGGGGNGSYQGGGGGGGGVLTGKAMLTNGAYAVIVGAGGIGYGYTNGISKGGDSSITGKGGVAIAAFGGGYGGGENTMRTDGGSGGGGAHGVAGGGGGGSGWAGPPRQGYDGGAGSDCDAGGGGGAGGEGKKPAEGRTGGPGAAFTFADGTTPVIYARGGNGCARIGTNGAHQCANTGNGGDAGGSGEGRAKGGHGGSGIVIVRYQTGIRNLPVSNLTTNGVTCNAWMVGSGGLPTAVSLLWGESDGAVNGAWANTNAWKPGAWADHSRPSLAIKLAPNRYYYYTFAVSSSISNAVNKSMSFVTCAVDVKASRPESTEEKPAEFVITRPATAANGPLEVFFILGGTGVNGTDYEQLDSPAVIPAGKTELRLSVSPKFNFGDQRPKSVELTLAPGGYVVGTKRSARILTRNE